MIGTVALLDRVCITPQSNVVVAKRLLVTTLKNSDELSSLTGLRAAPVLVLIIGFALRLFVVCHKTPQSKSTTSHLTSCDPQKSVNLL